MTKFIPILFSIPMVEAILEGRKNKTRRLKGLEQFNANSDCWRYDSEEDADTIGQHFMELLTTEGKPTERYFEAISPYKIGDVLWVRETFQALVNCETGSFARWSYKADMPEAFHTQYPSKWKPSIFMPKEACRIFLKVKSVRVERLRNITRGDVMDEGCPFPNMQKSTKPLEWFSNLWQTINGIDSWNKNPFVWVLEFERIEKPLDFI